MHGIHLRCFHLCWGLLRLLDHSLRIGAGPDSFLSRIRLGSLFMGMHPPKVETFDVAAGTNTDPKGIVRAVDTYEVHPWGLYMA
ncbi:MAG: hypothetical protein ACXVXJ_10915, partial [Mycobacteriaceae bacterium]